MNKLIDLNKALAAAKKAKSLLIEKGWTQGCAARNIMGYPVTAASDQDKVVCYCALGALWRGCGFGTVEYNVSIEQFLQQSLFKILNPLMTDQDVIGEKNYDELGAWNDKPERKKEEVIDLYDQLIAKLEKSVQN